MSRAALHGVRHASVAAPLLEVADRGVAPAAVGSERLRRRAHCELVVEIDGAVPRVIRLVRLRVCTCPPLRRRSQMASAFPLRFPTASTSPRSSRSARSGTPPWLLRAACPATWMNCRAGGATRKARARNRRGSPRWPRQRRGGRGRQARCSGRGQHRRQRGAGRSALRARRGPPRAGRGRGPSSFRAR